MDTTKICGIIYMEK